MINEKPFKRHAEQRWKTAIFSSFSMGTNNIIQYYVYKTMVEETREKPQLENEIRQKKKSCSSK